MTGVQTCALPISRRRDEKKSRLFLLPIFFYALRNRPLALDVAQGVWRGREQVRSFVAPAWFLQLVPPRVSLLLMEQLVNSPRGLFLLVYFRHPPTTVFSSSSHLCQKTFAKNWKKNEQKKPDEAGASPLAGTRDPGPLPRAKNRRRLPSI